MEQAAVRCRRRRRHQRKTCECPHGINAGEAAHGRGFRISFHAHELPGEKSGLLTFHLQGLREQPGRIDERVAV